MPQVPVINASITKLDKSIDFKQMLRLKIIITNYEKKTSKYNRCLLLQKLKEYMY
jgi:hypothetical protein